MLKNYILISALIFASCNSSDNSANNTKEIKKENASSKTDTFSIRELSLNKDSTQGWGADIRLSYTESTPTDKGTIYKVNSMYKNKMIGFNVTVPNAGFSKLTMESVGNNSNNFIHILSNLYKQKTDIILKFINSITADCVNLGDFIDSLNRQSDSHYVSTKSQYKLFFQGKNKADYAELFLNVNEKEHWIELEEKDEEYRPVIIKLLTHQ